MSLLKEGVREPLFGAVDAANESVSGVDFQSHATVFSSHDHAR
jgi:hypothetical protein